MTGNSDSVKEQGGKKKPATGFHTNPERINRKGRTPNDCSLTIAAKEYITANPQLREEIVQKVVDEARKGKEWAVKLFWSYMDGTPPKSSDDPGSPENPLHVAHHVIWE